MPMLLPQHHPPGGPVRAKQALITAVISLAVTVAYDMQKNR